MLTAESLPQAVTLNDGTLVTVREANPGDAPRLVAMHWRLSRRTLFLRYLSATKRLTPAEARVICDSAPGARSALVAAPAAAPDTLVAVAIYVCPDPLQPSVAEAAIVVEDAYQGRGLGRAMLWRLAIVACQHGVTTLTASVHYQNEHVTHFIRSTGLQVEQAITGGQCEFTVHLDRDLLARGLEHPPAR